MRFALRNSVVRDVKPTGAVNTVNAKDRHVAMAAITARATVAVTNDRRLLLTARQLASEAVSNERRPVRTPPISARC
jgi:hypothetical protein